VHVGTPDATQIQINLERAFPHLVEEALRTYDTVIIDAPPVVVCPETPPLSPFVDGSVLVVHSGRTKRETWNGRSSRSSNSRDGCSVSSSIGSAITFPFFIYKRPLGGLRAPRNPGELRARHAA
jgi:hypothetical protein